MNQSITKRLNYKIDRGFLSDSYSKIHNRQLFVLAKVLPLTAIPYEVYIALDEKKRIVWLGGLVGKVIAKSLEHFEKDEFNLDSPIEIFQIDVKVPDKEYELQYDEFL
jgi:hypothetical protein